MINVMEGRAIARGVSGCMGHYWLLEDDFRVFVGLHWPPFSAPGASPGAGGRAPGLPRAVPLASVSPKLPSPFPRRLAHPTAISFGPALLPRSLTTSRLPCAVGETTKAPFHLGWHTHHPAASLARRPLIDHGPDYSVTSITTTAPAQQLR